MIGPADYFAAKVLTELDHLINNATVTILAGTPTDFAAYRLQLGRLQGLTAARTAVVDLIGAEDMPAVQSARSQQEG
jgi:hypothetical protein